ncbi:hypothetical protein EDD85DRAFT_782989 [Armillaria nabsnona]|nr:hypothetical protein EDD85DRAFT_782989 [Armillaria nabsnona]
MTRIFPCQGWPAHLEPLALDTGIPPEQFKSLLVADHYILLCQAHNHHPAIVDMNTLVTYLQPEIKSILDSIHPFLAAHESYFPKDSDLIVICFLVTVTALANNLSPAFQSSQWDAWKIEDSTRMFKLLRLSKPRFNPLDTFPGKTHAPSLLSLLLKRNHFQVDHYLFLHLACTWYPQVLNFDILVNWSQLDVADLINHVHPFLNFKTPFPGDLHFPGSQHLVTQLDSSPSSKATPCTSDLPFLQLSQVGVYPIHLPAQLFSNFYLWPEVDLPAT